MSTSVPSNGAAGMRAGLTEFITQHLDCAKTGWPRLADRFNSAVEASEARTRDKSLRVLIVGGLALELPIHVDATMAALLASMRSGCGEATFSWRMSKLRVGEFLGYTVPVAAALGAHVSVCTVLPVPLPARLEAFLEAHVLGRRYVTAMPGPCPVVVRLRCRDGEVVLRRTSHSLDLGADLQHAATAADVILANPCHFKHRGTMIRMLTRSLRSSTRCSVVGLRADQRWSGIELEATRSPRVWTYLRKDDANRLAETLTGRRRFHAEEAVVRCLSQQAGTARLVMQLGSRGAILMNGVPCPYYVHTCPIVSRDSAGAGEVLLAVTTLSSAAGADDRTSLRRGVAAATGVVAGLPLPTTLDELDAT